MTRTARGGAAQPSRESLLAAADRALYRAKLLGRDCRDIEMLSGGASQSPLP